MNTFEERMERLQKRLDEINTMSCADVDQLLSTIPPLVCAADIDSPIADAIVQHGDPSKNVCPQWEYPDEVYHWDALKKEGLFNARGYAPIQYVCEQVTNTVLKNKAVV